MRVACRLPSRAPGGLRLRKLFAGLFLLLPALLSADASLRAALAEGLATLESGAPAGMVVALGTFTYADKKIGSPFSRLLESESAFLITQRSYFQLFARDRLEEMLEAAELSLSDLTDPDSRIEVGRLQSIQGLLGGRFFDEGTGVRVFLELADVERGTILGATALTIDKGRLPAGVSVLPGNYQDALGVLDELAEVENAANEEFIVKVWTPRGDGGTYLDGERLV
ncbi:MAG: hypothetical protein JW820_17105, partial [Spirochaetales bacterium]|nr:hypothetical protein [Spirochaetales bacterium]